MRLSFAAPLTLYVRVPGWAERATLEQAGRAARQLVGRNGTLVLLQISPGDQRITLTLRPTIRLEHWSAGGTAASASGGATAGSTKGNGGARAMSVHAHVHTHVHVHVRMHICR